MNDYTKEQRRRILAEVVRRGGAGDQARLIGELRDKGIDVTQATISRDLQEMGYAKIRVHPGVYRYDKISAEDQGPLDERLHVFFTNFVTDVLGTGNLLLVKTSPGNANGAACLIDALRRSEILGTIAGDDTVLIILDSPRSRTHVEKEFRALL